VSADDASTLRIALAGELGEVADPAVAAAQRAVDAGRAAWPDCNVPLDEFATVLGVVAHAADDPASALASLHAADLWLATACAAGIRPALDELDRRLHALRPTLRRVGLSDANLDDFLQDTRLRLVASASDRPARILSYQGRAELRAWLKVVVVRDAVRAVRRAADGTSPRDEIDVLMDPSTDPELAAMKDRYAQSFRSAFEHALAQLSALDRNLLRHHLVDGLTIDDLGAMHRVHRATAARWLVRIREQLYRHTRQQMMIELATSGHDFESVLRLIRSRMEASIARHLQPES
jgi:RNA polymerase sigma-70 factor (ECF subfamily)